MMACKGQTFTIEVDILPSLLAGFTLSALASSMNATIFTSDEPGEQAKLKVVRRVNPETVTATEENKGIGYAFACTASELSSILSALSIGGKDYTTEQIAALENITAMAMQGLGTAGTAGAVQYAPGLASPNATTQWYVIAVIGELPMDFKAVLGSSATVYLGVILPYSSVAVI